MSDAIVADDRNMMLDPRHAEVYGRYFRVQLADSPELIKQVYRLRYQVYCLEHGFEDGRNHTGEEETDEYDYHSVHAALIHRLSNTVCGCVRLILPSPGCSLPITRFISDVRTAGMPARGTAEVSRYAVSKAFRRRASESEYADIGFAESSSCDCRRLMPHVTLGLMVAIAALSSNYGVSHLAAVMTPGLIRLLVTCGMEFVPIGQLVEYHGMRQPCSAAVDDLLAGVQAKHPVYFDVIRSGLGNLGFAPALTPRLEPWMPRRTKLGDVLASAGNSGASGARSSSFSAAGLSDIVTRATNQ